MRWIDLHKESEHWAAEAERIQRAGDAQRARDLYAKAADAETRALEALDSRTVRTRGISAVSAISLWYKAHEYERAEQLAHAQLAAGELPEFAVQQLKELLQWIWNEAARAKTGLRFTPGQVVVAVKGGEVVQGGAPLDLIVEKVQTVQSLFYRTAELLKGLPHRKHGPPTREVQGLFRPWLFQAAPGSYQFAVAIQEVRQLDLFKPDEFKAEEISRKFMQILRATFEDPDVTLSQIVPDLEYRATFLKLTRNLAPAGKAFEEMEVRATEEPRAVRLVPEIRRVISDSIRRLSPPAPIEVEEREEHLRGILRALHLDQDWLEVTVEFQHIRVEGVGEAVDDVIGPMVNRPVLVTVARDARGRHVFRDIEPME